MASIKNHIARLEVLDRRAAQVLFEAIRTDLSNVGADIAALDTALDAMATKLNADAGVTDVDYAGALTAMTSGTLNLEA